MSRTITVKGVGSARTKPDYVIIKMKLTSKGTTYAETMAVASTRLEELNVGLQKAGFAKDAIKTTDFSVATDYESYKDRNGDYQKRFRGFECEHKLKLAFDFDTKRLAEALTAIAQCDAKPEFNIGFTVKDETAVKEELLRSAAQNAQKTAQILCEATGAKLGELLTISYNWDEITIFSNTRFQVMEECLMAMPSMDMEPDDIDTSDTATFIWEIV